MVLPERHPLTETTFAALGVPAPLVAALTKSGIDSPFPIQQDTLPDTLAGRDVLGRGKTGSGKTIAFALPLVTRLAGLAQGTSRAPRRANRPTGLVLALTVVAANELADAIARCRLQCWELEHAVFARRIGGEPFGDRQGIG